MNAFGLVAVLSLPYVHGSLTDTVLDRQQPQQQARTFEAAPGKAVGERGGGAYGTAPGETLVLCQGARICLGQCRFGGVACCEGGLACQGKAIVLSSNPRAEGAREGGYDDELFGGEEEEQEEEQEEEKSAPEGKQAEGEVDEAAVDSAELEEAALEAELHRAPELRTLDAAEGLYSCSWPQACDSWTSEDGRLVCTSGYTCSQRKEIGIPADSLVKFPSRNRGHAIKIPAKKVVKFPKIKVFPRP